jgi:ABC-2 type transport system ATP-binding protein
MEEVEQLCDRVLLLKNGRAALHGTIDEIKDSFGARVIALNYSGQLPHNDKLYEITKQLAHYAELHWRDNVSTDEVLRFLAACKDLHLTSFEISRPTLNDIFLELYRNQGVSNG